MHRRLQRVIARLRRPAVPDWSELPPVPVSPLTTLDQTQVSSLWRKSRSGLTSAATSEEFLAVVTARGALLDDLERRDPQAYAAWLAAGGEGEPDGPPSYLLGAAWHGTGDR